MDVKLPNGKVIRGVPEGTTKEEIQAKAIASGMATEQDFAPAPTAFEDTQTAVQQVAEEQGPLDAALIAAGRGYENLARGIDKAATSGWLGPFAYGISKLRGEGEQAFEERTQAEEDAYKALQEASPISTMIGEAVGEAAPLAPVAAGTGAMRLGGRVASNVGIGAAEGGLASTGRGENAGDIISKAGATGAIAGTVEAVSPIFGRGISKLWQRITGDKPADYLSREGVEAAMREMGLGPEDFTEESVRLLNSMPDGADPAQALRAAKFRQMSMEPTRAQVTRNAADFQTQQEAAKTSGRIREALEKQEGQISRLFDDYGRGTGGQISEEGNSVVDTIINRQTLRDERIGELYRAAREAAPDAQNVKLSSFVKTLKDAAPQNELTGGLIKAIRGDLQQRGVIGKGFKRQGIIDVSTAEDIRKTVNQFYNSTNDFGRMKIRELKEALDDDVFRSAGDDVFAEARAAKAEFERQMRRAKVSKFDARKQNLVMDVIENKISPDTFVKDTAMSKKWRAEDIAQLRDFTIGDGDGAKAWNDYRAEVLQSIKDSAFTGPVDEQGYQAISRAGLDRALEKIGTPKLKEIFNADELRFLRDLKQITALREPVRGTAQGRGPSAQAISKLEEYVRTVPLAGALIGDITDVNGRLALRSSPDVAIKPIPRLNEAAAAGGLGLGAIATKQEEEK